MIKLLSAAACYTVLILFGLSLPAQQHQQLPVFTALNGKPAPADW